MALDQALDWFMNLVGWRWADYWLYLLGCLVLWALLSFLTPANRVAAFVFSFSAWFALVWTLALVEVQYKYSHHFLDPGSLFIALPLTLFAYCTFSSLFYFRAAYDVDVDATRFIRWAWVLLPAHLYHLFFLLLVEDSIPPTGG
jgi:hypothetical protein